MHKNLRLSCVLILVTLLYSGCGLLLNTMGASLFLSWLFWNLFLGRVLGIHSAGADSHWLVGAGSVHGFLAPLSVTSCW